MFRKEFHSCLFSTPVLEKLTRELDKIPLHMKARKFCILTLREHFMDGVSKLMIHRLNVRECQKCDSIIIFLKVTDIHNDFFDTGITSLFSRVRYRYLVCFPQNIRPSSLSLQRPIKIIGEKIGKKFSIFIDFIDLDIIKKTHCSLPSLLSGESWREVLCRN